MTVTLEVTEGIHHNPWYNFNLGGWQKVIGCQDCNSYFADNDINPYDPCRNCGGFISGCKSYIGKWYNGKWVKRMKDNK